MSSALHQRIRTLFAIPFVQNVAKFQIGTTILIATGFVSSIIYARLLGVEQFGLYAVVSAFTGLITIITRFGQETTLTTFLPEAFGRKDTQDIARALRYFIQSTALSLVLYAILFIWAPQLAHLFQGNPQIGILARFLIINTMLQSPAVVAFLVLQMNRQVGLVTILEDTRAILQVGLGTFLILRGYGLEGVLIGTTAISAIYVPLSLWLYERTAKKMHFPSLWSIFATSLNRGTGDHFWQGLWIALDQNIMKNIYPNLFYLALNATASLEAVGIFKIAMSLADVPGNLVMPGITRTSSVSIPHIVGQNRKALKSSCIKLIKGSMALIVIAVVGAMICIPIFLPFVYGKQYIPAIPIFLLLVPTNIFAAMHVVSVPLARVFKRVWAIVIVNLTGVLLALALFSGLHLILSPLIAMALAISYFYLHTLLIYVYLWQVVKRQSLS